MDGMRLTRWWIALGVLLLTNVPTWGQTSNAQRPVKLEPRAGIVKPQEPGNGVDRHVMGPPVNYYYIPGPRAPEDESILPVVPGQASGPVDPALQEQLIKRGEEADLHWNQYSWLYWWAWNRDQVIGSFGATPRRPREMRPSAALTSLAMKALGSAAGNPEPAVRIEAAIALGRTRDAMAMPLLQKLGADSVAEVRFAAVMAIGLLRGPDSEQALMSMLGNKDPAIVLGAVEGIGMLDRPATGTIDALVQTYGTNNVVEIRRMILWCMRGQPSDAGVALARSVLQHETNPLLASEAALTVAPAANSDDGRLLGSIATYALVALQPGGIFPGDPIPGGIGPAAQVSAALSPQMGPDGVRLSSSVGRAGSLATIRDQIRVRVAALPDGIPCLNSFRTTGQDLSAGGRLKSWHLQTLYAASVMALGKAPLLAVDAANATSQNALGSAVYSLGGGLSVGPGVSAPAIQRPALAAAGLSTEARRPGVTASGGVGLLTGRVLTDAFISVPPPRAAYQGLAMISYGRSEAVNNSATEALTELLDVRQTGPREQQLNIDAPNEWVRRGFAAIAIAIQDAQRPNRAAADPRIVSAWDPIYRDMIAAAQQPDAPDVRAAYLVAPAVAGRSSALAPLLNTPGPQGERAGLAKDSPFVYAHLLLARAMLGDPTAASEAAKLLGPPQAHLDPATAATAIPPTPARPSKPTDAQRTDYWRRSILLTVLALSGDKKNVPALNAQWGHDPWLTYEAARAMGWCHAFDNIPPLASLLTDHPDSPNAAVAARTLGELLDPDRPSRLSRLLIGNCYVQLMSPDAGHFTWPADRVEPMSHLLADPPLFRFLTAGFDPTTN